MTHFIPDWTRATPAEAALVADAMEAARRAQRVAAQRSILSHRYARTFAAIRKAKENRAWLKKLAATNPGAQHFYGENLDLVLKAHREVVGRARREIARLEAR